MTRTLTPAEQAAARQLLQAGARDETTAKIALDPGMRGLNAKQVAGLVTRQLAASRVRRMGHGDRRTHYWLTPAGVQVATFLQHGAA